VEIFNINLIRDNLKITTLMGCRTRKGRWKKKTL